MISQILILTKQDLLGLKFFIACKMHIFGVELKGSRCLPPLMLTCLLWRNQGCWPSRGQRIRWCCFTWQINRHSSWSGATGYSAVQERHPAPRDLCTPFCAEETLCEAVCRKPAGKCRAAFPEANGMKSHLVQSNTSEMLNHTGWKGKVLPCFPPPFNHLQHCAVYLFLFF